MSSLLSSDYGILIRPIKNISEIHKLNYLLNLQNIYDLSVNFFKLISWLADIKFKNM